MCSNQQKVISKLEKYNNNEQVIIMNRNYYIEAISNIFKRLIFLIFIRSFNRLAKFLVKFQKMALYKNIIQRVLSLGQSV